MTGFDYFHCPECDIRFLDPARQLTPEQERLRYLLHENNVEDESYQKFVSPMLSQVQQRFKKGSLGLDFGCGPGPALAQLLVQAGYPMELYDPFFKNDPGPLARTYDFVVTTETVEHFYLPHVEFTRLRGLLKPGGGLGVMTSVCDEQTDFANWYYRRDPTHVSFYSQKTFQWIQRHFRFASYEFSGKNLHWLATV